VFILKFYPSVKSDACHNSRKRVFASVPFTVSSLHMLPLCIPTQGYKIQRLLCPWSLIWLCPSLGVRALTRHKAWHHLSIYLHIPLPSGHLVRILYRHSYSKNNKMHLFLQLFILVKRSTCFGRSFLPSSGAQDCTYTATGICQTGTKKEISLSLC
jgi:hypothetical protein